MLTLANLTMIRWLKILINNLFVINRRNISLVLVALTLTIVSRYASVKAVVLFKELIDVLENTVQPAIIITISILAGYATVRILSIILRQLQTVISDRLIKQMIERFSNNVMSYILSLSMSFHDNKKSGIIMKVIDRGILASEKAMQTFVVFIIPTIVELVFAGFVIFNQLNVSILLILILTMFLYLYCTVLLTELRQSKLRQVNDSEEVISDKIFDYFTNISTIKAFAQESYISKIMGRAFSNYTKSAVRSYDSLAFLNLCQDLILLTGIVLSLYLTIDGIYKNEFSVGDLILVSMLMMQVADPMGKMAVIYRDMKESMLDFDKLLALLKDKNVEGSDSKITVINEYDVSFQGVAFSYINRKSILNKISFNAPNGKLCAFVGKSGAGKSTIARLLLKLYEPLQGKIRVGGHDIGDIGTEVLRKAIGYVSQDVEMFNTTILENMIFGSENASKAEVVKISKLVNLHDMIAGLPEKYDTLVGERGIKLSGGEKQRVGIARILLKKPKIVIMDEATSALDSKNEQNIMKQVRVCLPDTTFIIIAHRLSSIRNADAIYVFENGKIVETGTHDFLARSDGLYAELWKLQRAKSK